MGISTLIAFTPNQTLAQEAKDKKPASGGHSHFTKIPATLDEIWKEIHKQQARLSGVVAKKDLGEAHDHAFAIRDLVKALPAKVPVESKAKVEESVTEITRIASDIDKSGAAGAQKATETNVKKMETAINGLRAKLQPNEPRK
jgi:hypothetical protein